MIEIEINCRLLLLKGWWSMERKKNSLILYGEILPSALPHRCPVPFTVRLLKEVLDILSNVYTDLAIIFD
jgi:hypothetical protein